VSKKLCFNNLFKTLFFLFFVTNASATIWSINNVGIDADFASINEAHDSENVKPGDTLYITGTTKGYGDFICAKKLNIIGPGYVLSENKDTQANLSSASIGTITYNPGSEGSSITGMVVHAIDIYCSDITIRRNMIASINFHRPSVNILIVQNYIKTSGHCIFFVDGTSEVNNLIISNNILVATNSTYAIVMRENDQAIIKNNVIYGALGLYSSTFYNNILYSCHTAVLEGCDVKNNIGFQTHFGTTNGNQSNIDMSTVFIGTGSQDGKWQLAENSPAKNAGFNGEDCGAFDGNDPYILSGIPMIPAIYFVDAPAIASELSGLPVHIKVKSRN